jgi:hypothetical protein
MKKKSKKLRRNSSQISIPEYNFHRSASRGNSYQNVLEHIEALKKKLRTKYNNLIFEHPDKIFNIEKQLLLLLSELD